jgi:polyisoprenoid-binding protein YceI
MRSHNANVSASEIIFVVQLLTPRGQPMNAPTIVRPGSCIVALAAGMLSSTSEWQPTLSAAALSACVATLAVQESAQAQRYTIDAAQTRVSFEVRTFGIFRERGWFDAVTGTLTLDSRADTGQLHIVIDANSLRARNGTMERLIRGPAFLNIDQYPAIAYDARRIVYSAGKPDLIDGELTMRGVTKSVPLRVTRYTCVSGGAPEECVMDARATLRRSAFGMTGYKSIAAEKMQLSIRAEGILVEGSKPPGPEVQ